jgi:hypothetical protein
VLPLLLLRLLVGAMSLPIAAAAGCTLWPGELRPGDHPHIRRALLLSRGPGRRAQAVPTPTPPAMVCRAAAVAAERGTAATGGGVGSSHAASRCRWWLTGHHPDWPIARAGVVVVGTRPLLLAACRGLPGHHSHIRAAGVTTAAAAASG